MTYTRTKPNKTQQMWAYGGTKAGADRINKLGDLYLVYDQYEANPETTAAQWLELERQFTALRGTLYARMCAERAEKVTG
jgi:hypothetical protein